MWTGEKLYIPLLFALNIFVKFGTGLEHLHNHENKSDFKFFVPSFKAAAPLAVRLFSLQKGHFG